MKEMIILKPTDYVAFKDGKVDYSYAYDTQYSDGEKLNQMTETELAQECKKRWDDFKKFPYPSNYSKLSLAQDLARAKGFNVSFGLKNSPENIASNNQREF